jgi:hypothetical protein
MANNRIQFALTKPSSEQISEADKLQAEFRALIQSDEYREAVRLETEGRDMAFVDLSESVCGFELRQMTAVDLLNLTLFRSPFLASGFLGGELKPISEVPRGVSEEFLAQRILIPRHQITAFLWVMSVDFAPMSSARGKWRHFRHTWRCWHIKYGEACEAIRGYVNGALADKPNGSGRAGHNTASWLATTAVFIAKTLHWSECEILNMPLARLFQYERAIIASLGRNSALSNRSDRLKSDFLRRVNAQRKGAN